MSHAHIRGITAAVLAAIAGAGCASQGTMQTAPAPAKGGPAESSAIAQAHADSIRHPYTAADVKFMQGMIGHHGQAIVMAGWAPTHDASPSLQTLASRIINSQQDEIATMQHWLADRRQTVPDPHAPMTMMMNGVQQEMLMPGMLTKDQMAQLDHAKGDEFDRLFLTFMIQHHRGAVSMVHDLFESQGAAQDELVFKFASDVNVDQTTEIARMERMLAIETLGSGSP
jgi:uncharacterized protein (DUF305 family)